MLFKMVNIKPFVEIFKANIQLESIIFDPDINRGKYCCMPYNKNKHGCPNFNKPDKLFCPPHAPYYGEKIKEYSTFILVYTKFDFKAYKEEMREEWIEKNKAKGIDKEPTEKQIACNLYWQLPLKNFVLGTLLTISTKDDLVLACGSGLNGWYSLEAVGINVFETYRNNGIDFEERPKDKIVMCSLICKK